MYKQKEGNKIRVYVLWTNKVKITLYTIITFSQSDHLKAIADNYLVTFIGNLE